MKFKSILAWTVFPVLILAFAGGSIWPFINAWQVHDTPAFQASRTFVLKDPDIGAISGGHRVLESDWFPKGGYANGEARFEHKVVGDLKKMEVAVILKEEAGNWVVKRAAIEDDEGNWDEITLHLP